MAETGIDPVLLTTASARKFDVSSPDELPGAITQDVEAQKQAVMRLFGHNPAPERPKRLSLEERQARDEERRVRFEKEAEWWNSRPGELTGYDCPECMNRGDFEVVNYTEGYGYSKAIVFCNCREIRRELGKAERSGLGSLYERCTFETYNATEPWQKRILEKAKAFVNSGASGFYIGGQVGAGKTHICTAIVGELLRTRKLAPVYMLWRDEVKNIKNSQMEREYHEKLINRFRSAQVLYIDDLFKGGIADTDTKALFDIINHRWINNMLTVISSEYNIKEIIAMDEAVGSRIYEMCKGAYTTYITPAKGKNYRMREGQEIL